MEEKTKKGNIAWELVICAAIFALAVLALREIIFSAAMLAYAAELTVFLLILITLPAIYMFGRRGLSYGMSFLVFGAAVCYALLGMPGLVILGTLLPVIAICSYVLIKKGGAYEGLVMCCGAGLLSVAIVFAATSLALGKDPVTYVFDYYRQALATDGAVIAAVYPLFAVMDVLNGAATLEGAFGASVTAEYMKEYMNAPAQIASLSQMVGSVVPRLMMSFVMYGGLASFFLPRAVAKKTGGTVGRVPRFCDFILPKSVGIAFVAMFALSMLPELAGLTQFYVAGDVLMQFVSVPFIIVGASLLDYFFRRKIKSNGGRAVLLIVLAAVFSTLMMWIGIVEQLIRFRERVGRANTQNPGEGG